ncbi:MAG: crossover junction endodeoxyribonuclease RuvC [Patescibacteria group bacterium]
MVILGVDPGIARCGWGVITMVNGQWSMVNSGCIETSPKKSQEQRLKEIYSQLSKIIKRYKPDSLAIEELYFGNNSKTAMVVGEARGIILLVAAENGLQVSVYTPLQVKLALTGFGGAEKPQVAQMVKTILKLEKLPKLDDTTDALAIALTHAFSSKLSKQISSS